MIEDILQDRIKLVDHVLYMLKIRRPFFLSIGSIIDFTVSLRGEVTEIISILGVAALGIALSILADNCVEWVEVEQLRLPFSRFLQLFQLDLDFNLRRTEFKSDA